MLVSSHLMSEVQMIADRVVVIGRGRLIADADVDDVLRGLGGPRVRVRTTCASDLERALADHAAVERTGPDELEVTGLDTAAVGDAAHAAGVPLHHLAEVEHSLERAYLSLTAGSADHQGRPTAASAGDGR